MSVKDRLDRLEERIGVNNDEIKGIKLMVGQVLAAECPQNKRIQSNADDINTLEVRAQFNNGERRNLEGRIEDLEEALPDVEGKVNTLKEALPDVEGKIKYMSHQIEDLQKILCKCNTTPATTKPEKFIKVKNTHRDIYLLRFNDLAIKSSWDEEEDQQIPGEIIFTASSTYCIIKSYSDKEAWQHDLNKIEWFIYDDALLLDLTSEGVWDEPGTKLWSNITTTSNNHDICPNCGDPLFYYMKDHTMCEAGRACIKCNYKES